MSVASLIAGRSFAVSEGLRRPPVYSYRSRADHYLFHRCEYGNEWTEHQTGIDPTAPVSSDEVIEIHIHLAALEGSITELLQYSA